MANLGMSLEGKRVVVIGGGSGIGFAVAELARAEGASVVIGSSSESRIGAAASRLSASAHTVDLRDEGSVATFFEKVGGFDHLALTAGDWGSSWRASVRDIDIDAARDGLTVRFWGVLAAVKHASRTIAARGSITLTSGVLAHRPMKGAPLATAIGGAIEHLARGLAMDLAPIRVNAVCPGLVLTEQVKQMMPGPMIQGAVAALPIPRTATPEEAAKAYVYLMLNDYATAQVIPVDGGALLI